MPSPSKKPSLQARQAELQQRVEASLRERGKARQAIMDAKRDFAGFIEGEQPNISEDQFKWLSYRMSWGSDNEASMAIERENPDDSGMEWLLRAEEWRQDPSFAAVEQIALGNKREGFRILSVHLAGKSLRQINAMLSSSDPKIVIRALTLWERTLGLLVDKVAVVGKDELTRLAERLMTPVTITPIEGPSIIDAEFSETPALPPKSDRYDTD